MNLQHIRKKIGSYVIGKHAFGQGIILQIPFYQMTDEQQKAFGKARLMLIDAGISCDSGMGCGGVLNLNLDWSLHGASVICKRCGYYSDDKEYDKKYNIERLK